MRGLWIIFLLHTFIAHGQTIVASETSLNAFDQYLSIFTQADGLSNASPDISNFINRLERKDVDKNTVKFCHTLFHKTHQDFLRRYDQYATFRSTLVNGTYNCLTGTALYALLLDYFGIDYTIIETNYHIFLLASTREGQVLFEATDPIYGFVSSAVEIEKRITAYKQNELQGSPADNKDNKKYYAYTVNLYSPVSLKQLTGLLHYNMSTEAYNKQNFQLAIHHLEQALDLHPSVRIREFSSVLLLTVMESKLQEEVKQDYLRQIQAIRKKQVVLTASRIIRH